MDILKEVLFEALAEAEAAIPSATNVEKRSDAILFGDGGFDSMGLVQFIVIVEERIEEVAGVEVRLASDKAMSRQRSPFATLGTLADFIRECIDEAQEDG